MTYKKAYILLSLYFLITACCILLFGNFTLNTLLIIGSMVLRSLLLGYAKDHENQIT